MYAGRVLIKWPIESFLWTFSSMFWCQTNKLVSVKGSRNMWLAWDTVYTRDLNLKSAVSTGFLGLKRTLHRLWLCEAHLCQLGKCFENSGSVSGYELTVRIDAVVSVIHLYNNTYFSVLCDSHSRTHCLIVLNLLNENHTMLFCRILLLQYMYLVSVLGWMFVTWCYYWKSIWHPAKQLRPNEAVTWSAMWLSILSWSIYHQYYDSVVNVKLFWSNDPSCSV